jgi:hypothetical protein
MTGSAHHIIQHLFKANSLEEVSVKEIEDLRDQFPFFNVGHYLLSKKLYSDKADNFLDETKTTALYFNNPFWLQWLLQNAVDEKLPDIKKEIVIEENKIQNVTKENPVSVAITEEIPVLINAEQIADKAIDKKDEELAFSPYHTVDYFASLGIKLILEENPNDKFGKQLRSFTDWIRTMKKLPQKVAEDNFDAATQDAIEGFAAHSLQQKEIITEAMADVLAKQGKNENAIELYNKLSLLNPGKSAYFAAKIEQLNEH